MTPLGISPTGNMPANTQPKPNAQTPNKKRDAHPANPPDAKSCQNTQIHQQTTTLTKKDIAGTWAPNRGKPTGVETMSALTLNKNGTWQEIENHITRNTPAQTTRSGEWKIQHGIITRAIGPFSQTGQRIIQKATLTHPRKLILTSKDQKLTLFKYETEDSFVHHTRDIQRLHQNARRASIILILITSLALGIFITITNLG
jgi:hypothetical protein